MNTQAWELGIAYGTTALAMLAGLRLLRAGGPAYWRWPVYSAMAMVLGVVLWSMLRKHLLPAEWLFTRPRTLLWGALVSYASIGFGTGALLGRLTRTAATEDPSPSPVPGNPSPNSKPEP